MNIIPDSQYGFRRRRGCNDYMLSFLSEIHTALSLNETLIAVSLDISSAYDNVSIPVLCNKMIGFGISERDTDVIWASNLELLELIVFSKRASSAKRCAAGRHRAIDEDHARCLPAAQRFALLALLEKKLTRVVPNLKPRSRHIYEDHAQCLPAAQRFALLALLEKKINSSSSKFEAQITSVPLITNR
ncbi:hypothetical protein J6590_072550 [Homalodisca vitripennis]|nr:hypothetical protein J6590_072550 [Homalodisca vitripennis]